MLYNVNLFIYQNNQMNSQKANSNATDKIHKLQLEQNLHFLDSENSFLQLEPEEKLYAYAMYKASWAGSLIVSRQISSESGHLVMLFTNMFRDYDLDSLFQSVNAEADRTTLTHLLNYVAILFASSGNYLSFGDSKFIPGAEKEDLRAFISLHFPTHYNEYMALEHYIYSLNEDEKYLGYPPQTTTYFSVNMSEDECKLVDRYLTYTKLEGWNTRAYKEANLVKINELIGSQNNSKDVTVLYVVRVASAYNPLHTSYPEVTKFEDSNFVVVYEDHKNELEQIVKYLQMAMNFTKNTVQQQMLASYIWHFKYGSIDDHKESQRKWVTDKGPAVETNIGFIENYRDPSGIRSEFESFVSIVDKEKTKKFRSLVESGQEFVKMLPWNTLRTEQASESYDGAPFEKDIFMAPDFTSLDIIAFTSSGLPAGINIPNYDDIRQTIGFKNVSLDNVIRLGYKSEELPKYLSIDDGTLYNKYLEKAFAVDVAGHELFGHGSGKLFTENENGEFNFNRELLNPVTGQQINSWYKAGETWSSKFGKLSSSYEECRAECVGLFLASYKQIHDIFGHEESEFDDISYTSWLWMCRAGLLGLSAYNPEKGEFLQAHSHARYVIYKVLEEAGVASVSFLGDNDFVLTVNRDIIKTVGIDALSKFLVKLMIFKATADFENGSALFAKYSTVDEIGLKIRDIYLANAKPRAQYIQPTLKLSSGGAVEYVKYGNTNLDMIKSYLDKNIC